MCDRRQFLALATGTAALGALDGSGRAYEVPPPAPGSPSGAPDLCFMTARDLATLIRARKVSAREVMSAHLDQIRRLNPRVNAIVAKLDDDECLALADVADRRTRAGETLGALHGLPFAFKDLQPAVGFPWTRGSPIYKDVRPEADSVIVERIRRAGAVPIGKTNVPEFGLGSHTYNRVYGTTYNPYDLTKSAGGSSGGAAAALATGMLPIADGSDFGGSLRNPANFNNVVGLRPSVGLVPVAPNAFPFLGFSVLGPMGRTVADTAFLLSVIAGADPRDPGAYPVDASAFRAPLERSFRGVRVAWCLDVGGLPVDPRVRAVLEPHRRTFERLGCVVEDACPDLSGADEVFLTIRGFRSAALYGPVLARNRDQIKPEAIAEIEAGAKLSGAEVARAMTLHAQLLERVRQFQERYAFMVSVVNQVPPFDATLDWRKSINGVAMDHYLAWMRSATRITTTFRPAISVLAGFSGEGLPVGVQIAGRHRADLSVLQLAFAFEQETRYARRHPEITKTE